MRKRISICTSVILSAIILSLCLSGTFSFSFAEDDFTYLSDIKETNSQVGWGDLHKDEGLDSNPIKIWDGTTDKTYEKGIVAHAASEINYDISGETYGMFTAYIGVHNGTNNNMPDSSSVAFEVKADGVSIYKSGTFRMKTPAEYIEVEIPMGTKTLTLITTDAGDGNTGDHSAWADAKLVVGEVDPERMVSLTVVSEGGTSAKVGEKITLKVEAKRFNGTFFEPSNVKYTVDNPDIASVSDKGVVTLKSLGTAVISVTATEGDAVLTKKISVKGCDPELENSWSVASPDGKVKVTIKEDMFGALTYVVEKEGRAVVKEGSDLGMVAEQSSFSDGFVFVEQSTKLIDEKYTNYSGKESEGYNHANELTVRFKRGEYCFDLIFRAYDEGFAFRYTISSENTENGSLTFTDEVSSFVVPEKSDIYAITVSSLTSIFNHEAGYSKFKTEALSSKYLAFPILYKTTENDWVLLTEAELYGDAYVGSMTQSIGNGKIKLQKAPKVLSDTVESPCPFTSPWRMGIVGDLETIVESNLVEDVSERTDEDFSWVEPGVTAWMWLSEGFQGQRTYETIKLYIDLAYEMGWKYLILDEGWQPNSTANTGKRYDGYFAWFDEMVDYANDKGVGLIVWVLCNDLNTPEEREVLEEWAAKGIKGIKADFFDSEDADMIQNFKAIYEKCVECKLIANIHGANKPTGERQSYPNIINREAVNGEEYGGYSTSNTTIWPYTRGVVGPMDLTPRYYPSYSTQTTVGQQMAMNIVFECGIPCMASTPNEYLTTDGYLFYKGLPSAWDETEYISGAPGTYTLLARRSADNWYIGGITSSAKTVTFELDFLEEGYSYTALIFNDGTGKYDLITDTAVVKKGEELTLKMKTNGGVAVRLIRQDDENAIAELTAQKTDITMKSGQTLELSVNVAPSNLDFTDLCWTTSDESVVIVTRGSITALRGGSATITASSYTTGAKIEFNITVENEGGVSLAKGWSIYAPVSSEKYGFSVKAPANLGIATLTGDIAGSFRNVFYKAAPEGDFEVVVKVGGMFKDLMQTGGIVLFSPSDLSASIAVAARYCDPDGDNYPPANYFQFYSSNSGAFNYKTEKTNVFPSSYLKLVVKEGTCYGYSSLDGKKWTQIGSSIKIKSLMEKDDLSIGLYGCSGSGGDIINVTFAGLKINSVATPIFLVDGVEPTPDVTPDVTPVPTPDTTPTEAPDTTVDTTPVETTTPEDVTPEPTADNKNNTTMIVIVVVVALIILGAAALFVIKGKKK